MEQKLPLPPFTKETAIQKIRMAEDAWNTRDPEYMLSIADRGADALAASGRIGAELAEALKAEARQRVAEGRFFGSIAYSSLVAKKPDNNLL